VSALLLVAVPLVSALWRRRPEGVGSAHSSSSGGRGSLRGSLRLVLGSGQLRTIAGVVVISSFVTAVCGWQFRAMAQQSLGDKDAMAAFFGTFDAWVGLK